MKRRIGVVFDVVDVGGGGSDDGDSTAKKEKKKKKDVPPPEKIAILVPAEVTTVKDLKRFVVPKTSVKDGSWSVYQRKFAKEFVKAQKVDAGETYKFKSALYFYENNLRILDEDTLDIINDNDIVRCQVTAKLVKGEGKEKKVTKEEEKKVMKEEEKKVIKEEEKKSKCSEEKIISTAEKKQFQPPNKKQKTQTSSKHLFFDSDGEIMSSEDELPREMENKEIATPNKIEETPAKKKRKRRRKNKKKEDALVNVSVVLDSENPPPPNTPAHTITEPIHKEPTEEKNDAALIEEMQESQSPVQKEDIDIEGCESLSRIPTKGDVVGWKEVYLSENFVPEYTDWKVGTVSSVDAETRMVAFEEPAQGEVLFTHMLAPKLIKSAAGSLPLEQEKHLPSDEVQKDTLPRSPQQVTEKTNKKIPSCKGLAKTLAQIRRNPNNN